jgi:hypothetical protein
MANFRLRNWFYTTIGDIKDGNGFWNRFVGNGVSRPKQATFEDLTKSTAFKTELGDRAQDADYNEAHNETNPKQGLVVTAKDADILDKTKVYIQKNVAKASQLTSAVSGAAQTVDSLGEGYPATVNEALVTVALDETVTTRREYKFGLAANLITWLNGIKDYIDDAIEAIPAGTGEANTASNVPVAGTGIGLFKQKTGVDLEFKKIKAGTNVTITEAGDEVTINSSGGGGGGDLSYVSEYVSGSLGIYSLDDPDILINNEIALGYRGRILKHFPDLINNPSSFNIVDYNLEFALFQTDNFIDGGLGAYNDSSLFFKLDTTLSGLKNVNTHHTHMVHLPYEVTDVNEGIYRTIITPITTYCVFEKAGEGKVNSSASFYAISIKSALNYVLPLEKDIITDGTYRNDVNSGWAWIVAILPNSSNFSLLNFVNFTTPLSGAQQLSEDKLLTNSGTSYVIKYISWHEHYVGYYDV